MKTPPDSSALVKMIYASGADNAAIIPMEKVVTNRAFREICEKNACGLYNRCWVCPPDIGAIDDLMGRLKNYQSAILFQTIAPIDDSFDIEGMLKAGARHAKICLRIKREIPLKIPFLTLGGGGCHLCETCAKRENAPCRRPDDAIAGMESYGIDVYNTARNANLRYINGKNTVTYFGILLY